MDLAAGGEDGWVAGCGRWDPDRRGEVAEAAGCGGAEELVVYLVTQLGGEAEEGGFCLFVHHVGGW